MKSTEKNKLRARAEKEIKEDIADEVKLSIKVKLRELHSAKRIVKQIEKQLGALMEDD